jgi:Ser/Thr protein kinase RdoA (MazF antagonist)
MDDFYQQSIKAQEARMLDLARLAMTRWDARLSDISLIKYRENGVFSIRDDAGQRYALRIHRAGYHTDAELVSELQWMDAMRHAGIATPPVIPASDGSLFVLVEHPSIPEPRQVDLLGWLDGEPVGAIEDQNSTDEADVDGLYHRIGQLAARLHTKSAAWPLPSGFTRHSWDTEGLLGENPFWGRFLDLPALGALQRELIERACQKARQALAEFGRDAGNYGLIHADFVPENLLQRGEELLLIDFDDSGFGWHMFELATALYFQIGGSQFERIKAAILDGYRSVRALPGSHWAQLPLFLLLRSLTYLGWVHTRHETETARSLTPMFIERTEQLARAYLAAD